MKGGEREREREEEEEEDSSVRLWPTKTKKKFPS